MPNPTKNFFWLFFRVLVVLIFLLTAGCAKKIEKPPLPPIAVKPEKPTEYVRPGNALVKVEPDRVPALLDDADALTLEMALLKSVSYYERNSTRKFQFGHDFYSGADLKSSLLEFLAIIKSNNPLEAKEMAIRDHFNIYRSVGRATTGKVLFTGYFEPIINGSLEKSEKFNWPIYRVPDDLVVVDLSRFRDKYKGERIVGRVDKREIVPYYSRRDIDKEGYLSNKGLEIAWLSDPLDVFTLQIQGSGTICLPDNSCFQVSYAESNGRDIPLYRQIHAGQGHFI